VPPAIVKDKDCEAHRVYPRLHGGLKALVAPDRAGQEAVPNAPSRFGKNRGTQPKVAPMNLLEVRQKVHPGMCIPAASREGDSRGPAASRQIKKQ